MWWQTFWASCMRVVAKRGVAARRSCRRLITLQRCERGAASGMVPSMTHGVFRPCVCTRFINEGECIGHHCTGGSFGRWSEEPFAGTAACAVKASLRGVSWAPECVRASILVRLHSASPTRIRARAQVLETKSEAWRRLHDAIRARQCTSRGLRRRPRRL
eukprot:4661381-Prymnesium_polylepis.1